jgi:hypothetical protein
MSNCGTTEQDLADVWFPAYHLEDTPSEPEAERLFLRACYDSARNPD